MTSETVRQKSKIFVFTNISLLFLSVADFINQRLNIVLVFNTHPVGYSLKYLLSLIDCLCRSVVNNYLSVGILEKQDFIVGFNSQ